MKNINAKDYWNYDYIDLTAKKASAQEIVDAYGVFGWQETDREPDRRYFDVLHLSFKRERNIENKDSLQFLQVTFERLINARSAYEYRKNNKSTFIALTLGVVLACIVGLLITLAINASSFLIKGLLFAGVGVCAFLSLGIVALVKNVRKKENERHLARAQKINALIEETLIKVKELRGTSDEK